MKPMHGGLVQLVARDVVSGGISCPLQRSAWLGLAWLVSFFALGFVSGALRVLLRGS